MCAYVWVPSSVALSLIYGDKVSHWTWSSLFCLVWLAACSGDPIPAFVAWPLKVDHCVLAFYMGSGSLNFSLHLAWQCFSHWVISQHHLKNSLDTERRATDKRWCLAEWSTKARCRGKITPRKWFVMTTLNYNFMFSKSLACSSEGLLVCWSQLCAT